MIGRWVWKNIWRPVAAVSGAAVLLVVVKAPRTPDVAAPGTVEELARQCRRSGATGRDLADEAVRAVADAYPYYSLRHLWETPERSLRSHRGWSHQYNTILLLLLRELGFNARMVHAARVRGFNLPWFLGGHSWVKVDVENHELDACASSRNNRMGAVNFVALTPELPLRRVTRVAVAAGLVPFVVQEVLRAWLTGREIAPWVYGRRGGRNTGSAS